MANPSLTPRPPLPETGRGGGTRTGFTQLLCIIALLASLLSITSIARADDSASKVREGMRLYSAEQFEEASKAFSAANEALEKAKSEKAAIAAFDEACALHRKGDLEQARERYLKAGLSQDKSIATNAHFNIGLISSEAARKLAGETPESVPAEKRQEILSELSKSIDSYRHCLELEPKHGPARRNLELLRQWIKYYSDRWRAVDLEKRRKETNLIQFLEFMMQTQLAIKESVDGLQPNSSPNLFAQRKRLQEELTEEIPYLKDKIESELRPPEDDKKNTASATTSAPMSDKDKEELARGIALLNGWADEAAQKMETAGKELAKRQPKLASDQEQLAADKLDQIWDAVVPFHPLLAKELSEQTAIAKQLSPSKESTDEAESTKDENAIGDDESSNTADSKLKVNENEFGKLLERQERALRKARLLAPKAASELEQVKNQPAPSAAETAQPEGEPKDGNAAPEKIDPEAIKAGYEKAIELAPKAVEEMESAVKRLRKQERVEAATHAEEARRILKEIQDAQPKNPEQDKQDKQDQKDQNQDQDQDQKQNEDQKQEENKENQNDKKDESAKDNEQQKKQEDKKDADKNKEDQDKKNGQQKEPKLSKDRIEEAMRLVREREQAKRERDKELKARVIGRVPVDKDW